MNPGQRFRIVIRSMERKRAPERDLYHTLRHTRLAFHVDHLSLISGTIIGDSKGEAERAAPQSAFVAKHRHWIHSRRAARWDQGR